MYSSREEKIQRVKDILNEMDEILDKVRIVLEASDKPEHKQSLAAINSIEDVFKDTHALLLMGIENVPEQFVDLALREVEAACEFRQETYQQFLKGIAQA